MYRAQSTLILLALELLLGSIGYVTFGSGAAIAVAGIALFVHQGSRQQAARFVIGLHKARPLTYREVPTIHHLTEELAAHSRIPKPEIAVYPSDVPNAFALSDSQNQGIVAFSSSLLRLLDRNGILGVLAHEVAHLKNRDSLIGLTSGFFVQAISTIANVFIFLAFFAALGGYAQMDLLAIAVIAFVIPNAAQVLQAGLMRTRERLADQEAVALTGDARGLASALVKLERYNQYLAGVFRRFRFIYTSDDSPGSTWLRTHPSTEERVQNLLDLDNRIAPIPRELPYRLVI